MSAENNNNKGKFINAFQSIQMIGDYEGDEEEKSVANNKKPPSDVHKINNESIDDEEAVYKGDELYNPLEVVESSDDEKEESVQANSSEKSESFPKRKPSQTSNLNTALENKDEILKNAPVVDHVSIDNSKNDGDEEGSDNNEDMLVDDGNLEIEFNNEYSEEFQISKSPEPAAESSGDASNSRSVAIDDDDLLGTALAELEQEEKEAELQKLLEKERKEGERDKQKRKKKKDDKKKSKRKKEKKKKAKEKNRDKGEANDEKDEKRKKRKKKKEERRKSLLSASEDARTTESKNYKQDDSKNGKLLTKDKTKSDDKLKESSSSSSSSKHSKTKQREKSPPKKKDKKRRDSSQERKEKRNDEHSNYNHSTKDEKTESRHKDASHKDASHKDSNHKESNHKESNHKESSHKESSHKSKDRRSDSSEHRSRKRSNRDQSSEATSDKRLYKPIDNEKKKDKHTSSLHTKETTSDKKRTTHRDEGNTHEGSTSKHSSHKHRRHSISDARNSKPEEELKSPSRNKQHNDDEKVAIEPVTPILSKEQFLQVQQEAIKHENRKQNNSRYSDSENECEKLLRTASFMSKYDSHHLEHQTNSNILKSLSSKDYTDNSSLKTFETKDNSGVLINNNNSPSSPGELQVISPEHQKGEPDNARKNSETSFVDFEMSVNKATILVDDDDVYDVVISSQSDDGSILCRDNETRSFKSGSLSINEYKDRRKTGQKDEKETTSSASIRRRTTSRRFEIIYNLVCF